MVNSGNTSRSLFWLSKIFSFPSVQNSNSTTTLTLMALSITALSITALSITALSITALSITALSITALSIMTFNLTIIKTRHSA
jgi:hypothetical protein